MFRNMFHVLPLPIPFIRSTVRRLADLLIFPLLRCAVSTNGIRVAGRRAIKNATRCIAYSALLAAQWIKPLGS